MGLKNAMRVGIVGGGIIGLSAAWRLAQRGCSVVVCDANAESREASWAAAGMLAPHNEAAAADDLWKLCCESYQRWPRFIEELGLAAEDVDYREQGSLEPIMVGDDVAALEAKAKALAAAGAKTEWLDKQQLRESEPELSDEVEQALWMQGAQVNPRRVCLMLKKRCEALGVEMRYNQAVQTINGSQIVLQNGDKFDCDQVLLAAGAWTAALGEMCGFRIQSEPVKGQMMAFDADPSLLKHFIHSRHAYLVGRQKTGIVVGSTMEYVGFDTSDSQSAIAQLAAGAQHLLPALREAAIKETWTGLRPKIHGGLPMFARVNPQLCIATGHFRNGILLTPITADIVSGLVLQEKAAYPLEAFTGSEAFVSS